MMEMKVDDGDEAEAEAEEPARENVVLRMRRYIRQRESVHAANIGARPTVVAQRARPLCVLYHLDTFVGDAAIIIGLDKTVLIDCGFNWQGVRMAQVAKQLGAHDDMLIAISHFDKDHFYGVADIVKAYPNAKVISRAFPAHMEYAAHLSTCRRLPKPAGWQPIDNDLAQRIKAMHPMNCLAKTCAAGGHRFVAVASQLHIALGLGVTMDAKKNFMSMSLATLREDNASSVAWALRAGALGYYSAGDLETPHEAQVDITNVHILKCSHHGASSTSSDAFLAKVTPKVAIIQGPSPKHTHPHPDMLRRLHNRQVSAFATSLRLVYADATVPRPTVAGSGQTAGDIAVVMWDNDTFSMCFVDGGGLHVETFDANKEIINLDAVQMAALKVELDMEELTDLAEPMNLGLAAVKARGGTKTLAADNALADDAEDEEAEYCEFCGSTEPAAGHCEDCVAITCIACSEDGCPSCALRAPIPVDDSESDDGSDYAGSDDGADSADDEDKPRKRKASKSPQVERRATKRQAKNVK